MEKKTNPLKNSRILYIAVVAILCVTAIIIGIVAAANRAGTTTPTPTPSPDEGTPPADTEGPGSGSQTPPAGGEKPTEGTPKYLCPVSGFVSQKHDSETLVFSTTMGDWRVHTGLDIATTMGETVCAAAAGTVKEVWEDVMMGTCISIDHGNGVVSEYKNLNASLPATVQAGAQVSAGQAIGVVGDTALSELAEEPHLHFEMLVDGVAVDPLSKLAEESVSACLTFEQEEIED